MKRAYTSIKRSSKGIKLIPDLLQKFISKTHTIVIFLLSLLLIYIAQKKFTSPTHTTSENFYIACCVILIFFILQGSLYFPSGPFIHPHPIFWRFIFSISLLYLGFIIILYFLTLEQGRQIFSLIDNSLGVPLEEKDYAICCKLTYENIKSVLTDYYVLSHFIGWFIKALMIRHRMLLWVISGLWELVELFFIYALENFRECWWDSWIIDFLLCNGLGIELGLMFSNYLEMLKYNWLFTENNITWNKIISFITKLGPSDWVKVQWSHTILSLGWRSYVISSLIAGFTISDLNLFFLKHIFWIPPSNWLLVVRNGIIFIVSLPSLRQVYLYCENPSRRPFGMQAFVMFMIFTMEVMLILKYYSRLYPPVPRKNLLYASLVIFLYIVIVKLVVRVINIRKARKKKDD